MGGSYLRRTWHRGIALNVYSSGAWDPTMTRASTGASGQLASQVDQGDPAEAQGDRQDGSARGGSWRHWSAPP